MIDIESNVRTRAYEIWEAEGRPTGRDVEHWLAAEAACRAPGEPKAPPRKVKRTQSTKADGRPVAGATRSTKRNGKAAAPAAD